MEKEDKHDQSSTEPDANEDGRKTGCWLARYTVGLLGFLNFFMQYAMRVNMSVTIVPMADDFGWNEPTQGLVLSSFFYGYIVTQIGGGRAAEVFGGRIVVAASLIVTGIMSLLTPVVAGWSVGVLVAVRVVAGLAEGVAVPAMACLMTKWIPIEEKARIGSIVWEGTQLGAFVTLPVGGWLSASSLRWPSVFYITGALGIILGIVWTVVITDDPRNKKSISEKELEEIMHRCKVKENEKRIPVPWMSLLKSPHAWFIILTHFACNTCFYTTLTELPSYLVKIYDFSIGHAGTIAGLTYLSAFIFGSLYGNFVTFILDKKLLTVTTARRFSQGLCVYGTSVGFVCVMLTSNTKFLVAILIFNGGIFTAGFSGYMASHADISPRFAGTLMGLSNTLGTIPGFTVPLIVGAITHNNQTPTAWNYVFTLPIVCNLLFSSPFVFFFKAEVQPWNNQDGKSANVEENIKTVESVADKSGDTAVTDAVASEENTKL